MSFPEKTLYSWFLDHITRWRLHPLCSQIYTLLRSVRYWYACLVSLVWLSLLLCIFARLPTCSCMSLCVVRTPIQWNYGYSIQTYICPPRTLFCLIACLFAFLVLHMFVCPCLASFASLSFSMLYFYLFFYLSTGLFPCLLHVHARSKVT